MKKFKYLKISNTKKLRYIDNYFKKKLYIIFLQVLCQILKGKNLKLFKFAKEQIRFLSLNTLDTVNLQGNLQRKY